MKRTSQNRSRQVLVIGIISRVLTVLLGIFGKTEDYDQSGNLIFPKLVNPWIQTIIGPFTKWDAVYFLRIAETKYAHEQVHAFFPGLPLIMRGLQIVLGGLLKSLGVSAGVDQLALLGWIVSNVACVLAGYLLYKIHEKADEKLAFKVALIFSFSASSIFMSAVYTESVFAALSFACILGLEKNNFTLATMAAVLAGTVRANATFLVVYFVFIGIRKHRGFAASVSALLVVVTVQMYLYWSKKQYCDHQDAPLWCASQGIYGYVQSQYWEVGFLKYWQIKNSGFFLMALPTFLIAIRGTVGDYVNLYVCKLGEKNPQHVFNQILADTRSPYIAYLCICLAVTALIANVQIVTRLVCSSPAYYWAAANVFTSKSVCDKLLLFVHVVYFFIGPLLFCNFLPWT